MESNLLTMTREELKEMAKELGINGISTLRKPELIVVIEEYQTTGSKPQKKRGRPKKNIEIEETPLEEIEDNIELNVDEVDLEEAEAIEAEIPEELRPKAEEVKAEAEKPKQEALPYYEAEFPGGTVTVMHALQTTYYMPHDGYVYGSDPDSSVPRNDTIPVKGVLDVLEDGFGFLRVDGWEISSSDIYVPPVQIRRFKLRTGDTIAGRARMNEDSDKYPSLVYVENINDGDLEQSITRIPFEKLTPIYPTEKMVLDTGDRNRLAARLIDLVSPIGKGQRGMVVAPPKAGKTTVIKQIAKSIAQNYPDTYLMVLLIDERPEEVTDMQRSINGEIIASTFDRPPQEHCRIAEATLERACRMVEFKRDVVILMDSITRLTRAYNLLTTSSGRLLSGGLDPGALVAPKKFFGAARNIEEGGSLTIIATALVETGSRMDDVIFEEFKGTGNMELKLDRSLQEMRIFPAIDVDKSSTRREESLLSSKELAVSRALRKEYKKNSQNISHSMNTILNIFKNTANNKELVDSIVKKNRENAAARKV